MRAARQETIADIAAEMRDGGHTGDAACLEWVGALLRSYADRLAAAAEHARKAVPHGCSDCVWYLLYNDGRDETGKENARSATEAESVKQTERKANYVQHSGRADRGTEEI